MKAIKTGDIVILKDYCFTNNVGGTIVANGKFSKVRIIETWHDYEIGNRAKGILLEATDIDFNRKIGTTPFGSAYYAEHPEIKIGPNLLASVKEAEDNFKPELVFFGDYNVFEIIA